MSPPTIRTFLLAFFFVGLGVVAQLQLIDGRLYDALLLYGVAVVGFVWTVRRVGVGWLTPPHDESPPTGACSLLASSLARRIVGLLLSLLSIVLAALGLRAFHLHEPYSQRAWLYYGGSVALALLGAFALTNNRLPPFSDEQEAPPTKRWTVPLLLTAICLLGLFLRLYRFDELPFGTWYDEAENGLQALRLLADPNFRPIFANSTHAPAHYVYLIAGSFQLFGVSTQSIRLVSVLMGLGTILGGYLAGRELFGRAAGLGAAFLLAASRWDVNLSRLGMYNISTPLFALLSVGFLLRGLRRRALADFGLAGLFLGLGLSFYAAFQLIAAAMALFGLLLVLLEPRVWRRYWLGLLVTAGVAALVVAPVVQFAYDHPDVYFDRTQNTSIFADKGRAEWLPALADNARRHALMFNLEGDPNGRHNLPGAPMLDPVSAALFVLALALALWRWREPRWLLLPVWLGAALLGGILSLDFEAPQSLRAVGTLPAVYLLAAGALHMLWLTWSREGGRYYPAFFGVIAGLLLLSAALYDGRLYFYDQARDFSVWNAFSTPETITATLLQELDDGTEAAVSALFHGHPTMRFLAPDARPYGRLETDTRFPLPVPAERGLLLMVDADRRAQVERLRTLYPDAAYTEHRSPYGGPPSVYEIRLTPDDLASIQGLDGSYYANAAWQGAPVFTDRSTTLHADWAAIPPLPPPFSVEWRGVLRVDTYGEHHFQAMGPGSVQIWIDEAPVLDAPTAPEGSATLAAGNHRIRVRAAVAADDELGLLRVAWQPPDGAATALPAHALYSAPVTAHGLLGSYFPRPDWSGPPALTRIDAALDLYFHITPLPRPYTVEWTGKIAIPQRGRYAFGLESIDESTLWIDGREIAASPGANEYGEASVALQAGLHDIRVRFADRTAHTRITLFWRPPWGPLAPVPSEALVPPLGSYDRVTLPTVAELTGSSPSAQAQRPALQAPDLLQPAGDVVLAELSAPKGVAVDAGGRILVADTEAGRVLVIEAVDRPPLIIPGAADDATPETRLAAPFDLATDADGLLYVLDPELGRIVTVDVETGARRLLPLDGAYLERARGLFVAEDGTIWVAHTPGRRVAAFAADGELLRELAVSVQPDSQPVDVAVAPDGSIYVTDAGAHRLLRYAPDGQLADAWPIPRANSLEGSHLAVTADGRIVMTEPEQSRVVMLDQAGNALQSWRLPDGDASTAKPVGVAVDAQGGVWVADSSLGRLVRLE